MTIHLRLRSSGATMAASLLLIVSAISLETGSWGNRAFGDPKSESASSEAASSSKPEQSNEAEPNSNAKLSQEQHRIAEQYAHLEEVFLRMAELSPSTDPRRAALLKKAVAQSKERLLAIKFDELVELLDKGQLSNALDNQTKLDKELQSLLELLLSENRSQHIDSEKARIREYLKRLGRLIKQEKDLQGRTIGGADTKQLSAEQSQITEKTGGLAKEVQKNEEDKSESKEGQAQPSANPSPSKKSEDQSKKPGNQEGRNQEGHPQSQGQESPEESRDGEDSSQKQEPQHPARQRLESAQQRMREAEAKLKEAERDGAGQKQEEAILELERAKSHFEETLRQLREEEIERTLVMLEARFQRMLALQQEVYEGTVRLDKVPESDRTHNHEIEASRLSGKESQIVVEMDKALLILHEDGSAVAIPEASEQIREDMQQVVQRLAQAKVGKVTQNVEEDILNSLKEMIETLQKAKKDQEAKSGKGKSQRQQSGSPQDPPLVDMLAELKMIRALQMRINTRTERYSKMIEGEQATPEYIDALKQLAERQHRIYRVTHDLQMGKSK